MYVLLFPGLCQDSRFKNIVALEQSGARKYLYDVKGESRKEERQQLNFVAFLIYYFTVNLNEKKMSTHQEVGDDETKPPLRMSRLRLLVFLLLENKSSQILKQQNSRIQEMIYIKSNSNTS